VDPRQFRRERVGVVTTEAPREGDEAVHGRQLDTDVDRRRSKRRIDLIEEGGELEQRLADPRPLASVSVEVGKRRRDTSPADLDRGEPAMVLIDQRIEEVEDDSAERRRDISPSLRALRRSRA